MAVSQEFKTKVVFGGRIDPSFRRSTSELDDAIKQTKNSVSSLTRKQERLKEQITKTKLAGKNVSKLVADYKKVDREVKSLTKDMGALNSQMARQKSLGNIGNKIKSGAKWGGNKAWGALKGIGSGLKWGAMGGLGLAAGAASGAIAMNAETSEKLGLARSYGVDVEKYAAWENVGKMAGLNGENVGDLSEELTNKIGEIGNEKSLDPMLFQIGLSKKRMAGWDREKQFNEVMSRISKMKDEKQAASLADQLMGGEANKIMTYMKATGKTWEQVMNEAEKSNLLTTKGAESAARAHISISNLWGSLTSGLADTVGKISGELVPTFDAIREEFISWFKGNQGSIIDSVKEWLNPENLKKLWDGIVDFGEGCVQLGKIVWAIAKKLDWLIPDEKTDDEQKVYNEEYNKAYQEFMDSGGKYSPNAGLTADNIAKTKAEEAVENMRHPERKAQAENLFSAMNPMIGLMNSNPNNNVESPPPLNDTTIDIGALKQAVAQPAPEQNNKVEVNIMAAGDPQSIQASAASGVLEGLRKAAPSYSRGSMFDRPVAAG
ncbi:hypothetical protein [Escherichia fergusonii]|uniref:hypothetical protein n=1 Tax=Escherichia fergusonii TaxID=564 RepID=UPI0020CE9BE9|nr:hypothetical protein [Escherichia fergusonii]MCP9660865.1 hypothetical protein [Escherichia fergusonii]